eukprot:338764-Karenia_brevis.AAC.1
MSAIMFVAWTKGAAAVMEHPDVPTWTAHDCDCPSGTRPHLCNHVVSGFAILELRSIAALPGAD